MIIGIDASRANVAERTGTERYAFEVISRMLPKLGGHRVRLYVRETLRSEWGSIPSSVEVCVLRWPPAVLWTHLRLSWELFWRRVDVLFVPADTVPLIHPKNTITTIHDIAFERYPELYRGTSVQRAKGPLRFILNAAVRLVTLGRYTASELDYHRWSVRQAVRSCPTILTVSEFSKKEIADVLHVPLERIIVTPLGIHAPAHYASISEQRILARKKELRLTTPYALFIGRLESKKNIALLLQAYTAFRSVTQHSSLDLVLAGNPGYGWTEAVKSVGGELADGVHQLGWQSDEAVDELLLGASALVMVSEYEGFGLPAVEALSAGIPVIASRHGSLPEVLGNYAVYVDTTSVEELRNQFTLLSQKGDQFGHDRSASKEYAARYTWVTTAELTLKAIVS